MQAMGGVCTPESYVLQVVCSTSGIFTYSGGALLLFRISCRSFAGGKDDRVWEGRGKGAASPGSPDASAKLILIVPLLDATLSLARLCVRGPRVQKTLV